MDRKFSIIIPTMWRYEPFALFLEDLLDHKLIDEIIIINNDATRTPPLPLENKKLRVIDNGKNLKVNPSWNQGIRLCKNEDIAIINDDLIFDLRVFKKVLEIDDLNFGIAGISAGEEAYGQKKITDGIIDIIPWTGFSLFGFGQLMFIKKSQYVNIPYQLEVYYGDDWIELNAMVNSRNIYVISDILHATPYAVTSNEIISSVYNTDGQTLMNHERIWFDRYSHFLRMTAVDAKILIDTEYDIAKNTITDINEHVETLYQYALKCDTVTEFGVRTGMSSRAFLKAGRTLKSYDIVQDEKVQELFYAASKIFDARYYNASTLDLEIEPTDLLFIDTDHTYEQLSAELKLHADKVKKYIVFHDTTTYGDELVPAIFEFLDQNKGEWIIDRHFKHNNGLTILKRKGIE